MWIDDWVKSTTESMEVVVDHLLSKDRNLQCVCLLVSERSSQLMGECSWHAESAMIQRAHW